MRFIILIVTLLAASACVPSGNYGAAWEPVELYGDDDDSAS